jgi:hypothetical protein
VEDVADIRGLNEEAFFKNINEVTTKIALLAEYLRSIKSIYQNLIFVFEGTEAERMYIYIDPRVKECLIFDNNCPWFTYNSLFN